MGGCKEITPLFLQKKYGKVSKKRGKCMSLRQGLRAGCVRRFRKSVGVGALWLPLGEAGALAPDEGLMQARHRTVLCRLPACPHPSTSLTPSPMGKAWTRREQAPALQVCADFLQIGRGRRPRRSVFALVGTDRPGRRSLQSYMACRLYTVRSPLRRSSPASYCGTWRAARAAKHARVASAYRRNTSSCRSRSALRSPQRADPCRQAAPLPPRCARG